MKIVLLSKLCKEPSRGGPRRLYYSKCVKTPMLVTFFLKYLESQVAQDHRPVYREVALD